MASPLDGLDLAAWMDSFDVHYEDDPVLREHVAVHALTTYGRRNGLGASEIWIHPDFDDFEEMLVHHEAIENYLRRQGWNYERSHAYALRKDRERYGHTSNYKRMIKALR